jgi:hypothetical protein
MYLCLPIFLPYYALYLSLDQVVDEVSLGRVHFVIAYFCSGICTAAGTSTRRRCDASGVHVSESSGVGRL